MEPSHLGGGGYGLSHTWSGVTKALLLAGVFPFDRWLLGSRDAFLHTLMVSTIWPQAGRALSQPNAAPNPQCPHNPWVIVEPSKYSLKC